MSGAPFEISLSTATRHLKNIKEAVEHADVKMRSHTRNIDSAHRCNV